MPHQSQSQLTYELSLITLISRTEFYFRLPSFSFFRSNAYFLFIFLCFVLFFHFSKSVRVINRIKFQRRWGGFFKSNQEAHFCLCYVFSIAEFISMAQNSNLILEDFQLSSYCYPIHDNFLNLLIFSQPLLLPDTPLNQVNKRQFYFSLNFFAATFPPCYPH